jgi:nitrogen fixation NifU-like protein
MAYSEKVLDHYENPRNVGVLDDDLSVGTGMVGAPACGDVMRLQIKVSDDGIIQDAKFKTYGCGSAIASSSLVTEWVKGKSLDEAAEIKNTHIAHELAHSSIRFTIGRFTTAEEIDYTISLVRTAVEKLRDLSPLWDMYKDGIDLNSVEWVAH